MTSDDQATFDALLSSCQELRDAFATAMRVIRAYDHSGRMMAQFDRAIEGAEGFGVRADEAIKRAKGEQP